MADPDREIYVMVGDASGLMRAFKGKGVTSGSLIDIRCARNPIATDSSSSALTDSCPIRNSALTFRIRIARISSARRW